MTDETVFHNINASHLKKTLKAAEVGTIKVVLVGDSLSHFDTSDVTATWGQFNSESTLHSRILRELKKHYGDVTLNFVNRAIPSAQWSWLDTKAPTNLPSWYANSQRDWLDYIDDESPDLVIIGLGGNSPTTTNVAAFKSVMQKVQDPASLASEPDIVLMSTALGDDGDELDRLNRSGAMVRDYAMGHHLGLIDASRQEAMIRTGIAIDPVRLKIEKNNTRQAGPFAQQWIGSGAFPTRGHVVEATIDEADKLGDTSEWGCKIGGGDDDYVLLDNQGSNLSVKFQTTGNSGPIVLETFNLPKLSSGSKLIKISRINHVVKIAIDNVEVLDFHRYWSYSSIYTPVLGTYPNATSGGPSITDVRSWKATAYTASGGVLASELYGTYPGSAAQFKTSGMVATDYDDALNGATNAGDGFVHLSDKGVERVYGDVLSRQNWRPAAKVPLSGSGSGTNFIHVYPTSTLIFDHNGWQDWHLTTARLTYDPSSHFKLENNILKLQSVGDYKLWGDFQVMDDATSGSATILTTKFGAEFRLLYQLPSSSSWTVVPRSGRLVSVLANWHVVGSAFHCGFDTSVADVKIKVQMRKTGALGDEGKTKSLDLHAEYLGASQ